MSLTTKPEDDKEPTPSQLDAAFEAARKAVDDTGYGGYVSDDECRKISEAIAIAVVQS